MARLFLATTFLLLTTANLRSFVDTAALPPTEESNKNLPQLQDANVRDLESLKNTLGNTLKMMKVHSTVYTNDNGLKEVHSETHEEVNANGKPVAKIGEHVDSEPFKSETPQTARIQTDIEIPSEGIHSSIVQNLTPESKTPRPEKRRTAPLLPELQDFTNNVEKLNSYPRMQYSPLDMAEYVFWTGDEKGVTLAIEEFLHEGLMNREEAITFLQEIKYNLDYLQGHYTQLGLNLQDRLKNKAEYLGKFTAKPRISVERPELSNTFDLSQLRKEATKKAPTTVSKAEEEIIDKRFEQKHTQDPDYEELLERLRVADFLYTEYSLEEVIYQLAKVMFTQSLTHGNSEAQQALQKFTSFLESEAALGRISRALEKKVLDVLIASLTDTLSEYPELLSAARESLATSETYTEKQQLLRKMLDLGVQDKATLRTMVEPYIKEKEPIMEFKTNAPKHALINFGKYHISKI